VRSNYKYRITQETEAIQNSRCTRIKVVPIWNGVPYNHGATYEKLAT